MAWLNAGYKFAAHTLGRVKLGVRLLQIQTAATNSTAPCPRHPALAPRISRQHCHRFTCPTPPPISPTLPTPVHTLTTSASALRPLSLPSNAEYPEKLSTRCCTATPLLMSLAAVSGSFCCTAVIRMTCGRAQGPGKEMDVDACKCN